MSDYNYQDQILADIADLDNLATKNMVMRDKIVDKLGKAIDVIEFEKAGDMKASQILAITGLVNSLSGALNDMERSKMNSISVKQKNKSDDDANKDVSHIIAEFMKALATGNKDDLPKEAKAFDESLLDSAVAAAGIDCNDEELTYSTSADCVETTIAEIS